MDIVIRATVVFFVILLVTRVVGKRELATLEPFDLILLVVIGDLVQQGVTQSNYSLTGAILAILTICILTVATAYVNFRFRRLRLCSRASRSCSSSMASCSSATCAASASPTKS
jgi:uncharacterized membrane protein YcaP (DUF421 family)